MSEVVVWRYDCIRPIGDRKHLDPPITSNGRLKMDPEYWTETALVPEAELTALRERLEAAEVEIAKLRQMLVPQWFYQDGYSSEDCRDSPDEVLEDMDLGFGNHVVSLNCAGPMPQIWLAVNVRTDEQMDAAETDDRVIFTEHASEADARAALAAWEAHNANR